MFGIVNFSVISPEFTLSYPFLSSPVYFPSGISLLDCIKWLEKDNFFCL